MKSLLFTLILATFAFLSNILYCSGPVPLKDGSCAYQEFINSGFLPLADIQKVFMKDKKVADTSGMVLYVRKSCPYCIKVMKFLEESHIKILVKDASAPENREYLLKNAHKTQVPCLFIDEKPMFESDDIITLLGTCRSK
jgi:glutaredoxin 3